MTPAAAIPFDRPMPPRPCLPLPAVPKTVSGGKRPRPCGMAPALPAGRFAARAEAGCLPCTGQRRA